MVHQAYLGRYNRGEKLNRLSTVSVSSIGRRIDDACNKAPLGPRAVHQQICKTSNYIILNYIKIAFIIQYSILEFFPVRLILLIYSGVSEYLSIANHKRKKNKQFI